MNNLDFNASTVCKYEILAEILFHNQTYKNRTIKVLCSRLLARHRPWKECNIDCDILKDKSLKETGRSCSIEDMHTDSDYKEKLLLNDNHCTVDVLNKEDECMQDKFINLNFNESQEHAQWYAYWEKNGEEFVNETWVQKYGSRTTNDLPTDIEELYRKHCEEQYQILYWKFINETTAIKTEDHSYNNVEDNEYSSNYNKEHNNIDDISNFEFLYKFKHFQPLNKKLIKAYQAFSIIGYTYDNQNTFESAFVQYLKTKLVKSTRHLNVYKFPRMMTSKNDEEINIKTLNTDINVENSNDCFDNKPMSQLKCLKHFSQCGSSFVNNPLTSNFDDCFKTNVKKVKKKKALKVKKNKENRENNTVEELKRYGYGYLQNNPKLLKYWKRRHLLFTEFEKGIQLDEESWYSVTPELISKHIAERCSCYLIVDPFCGAGGNIIQFAKTCELVIAIDNDPKKIELARHNAELYGVADRIQFIIGDFFALAPTLKADVIFVSPPWGGPHLMQLEEYKLSNLMPENGGGEHVLHLARQITSNIALHLPKNINIFDCIKSTDDGFVEVQQNMLNSRYNSVTIYYSELYGLCEENPDTYNENPEQTD